MKVKQLSIATVALAMALTGCGDKNKGAGADMAQQAPEIAVMSVAPANTELETTFPATIKGKTDIDIRPQVTGFITKVHVDEGQQVKKGQVLFTLDQVQFQAAVEQAKAAVAVARTAVSTAQITADNKKALLDKNIISDYEYQIAVNSLNQAKAQLAQAEAAEVTARKNLAYTTVTAPSDGVVGSIPNREGSLASPSSAQPLTTVSDNSQVYAYFSLTERDILRMVNGGERTLNNAIAAMPEVQLRLADGSIYSQPGRVATVSGVLDASTGASNVRALFANPSGLLRSGSTGTIIIPHVEDSVIIIPQKATQELQDLRYVFVVNDSNMTVQTPIKVLDLSDGKNFVVTEGLKPGDRIVTEGVGTIVRNGMVIKPVTTTPAQ
ncbi:MAG: efflux RND transporter periplasmic adaptor subunit [Muribaculaceae bacterium]|nr:efflux RND transporter periplasmic adaptor subunit [Muribaculaceae bacterium]